jgi:hypothetical protein
MHKVRLSLIALLVVVMLVSVGTALAQVMNWRTHLTDDEEVNLVVDVISDAQGQAIFQLNADGTALTYRLNVANIENVTQAHIHQGAPGTNGPVVVWLYPSAPPASLIPGRFDGVLGAGTVTSANLVGPLAGQPLSSLVALLESGNAYVNVHTSQYPGGEIRGQVD